MQGCLLQMVGNGQKRNALNNGMSFIYSIMLQPPQTNLAQRGVIRVVASK